MEDLHSNNCEILLSSILTEELPDGDREEFFVDTLRIFGLFTSDTVFKKVVVYTVRWFYYMKDNDSVEKKVLLENKIRYDPKKSRKRTTKDDDEKKMRLIFSLNNSRRFLPVGDYSVEIMVDEGNSVLSIKNFKIVSRRGIYLGTKADEFGTTDPSSVFSGHDPVILGSYHFGEIKTFETIKNGKIEWSSILKPQEEEEEEEEEEEGEQKQEQEQKLIYIFEVVIPEKGQFNEFRFFLPKDKLPDGKYSPGHYKCVVYVNNEVVDQKTFEITPPEPRLFIGTKLTKNIEIYDDGAEIEGNSKKIIALYKFCRKINGNRKGRVKWLKKLVDHTNKKSSNNNNNNNNQEEEEIIYEHEIDCRGSEFELFISVLDNEELKLLPGRYSCEVHLYDDDDDELLSKKYFLVLPRFQIELDETRTEKNINMNKQEEEIQIKDIFLKGVKRINGSFTSNYVFPADVEVCITWVFLGDHNDNKQQQHQTTTTPTTPTTTLISKTSKKMKNKFARFDFFHEHKVDFPLGVYGVEVSIGGKILSIKFFKILEEEEYNKKIMIEQKQEKESRKKAFISKNHQKEEEEEVDDDIKTTTTKSFQKKFEVVKEGNLLGKKKNYWWCSRKFWIIFACFVVLMVAWFFKFFLV